MVLVLVLIDFLLLVSSWRYLRNLLATGDMFIASVKKGKPELRKKGNVRSCLLHSSSHARRGRETAKGLEKKERHVLVLRR